MATLQTPLPGVVGSTAPPLARAFGMRTVGDLLRHYPRRYEERGQLSDLGVLREGEKVTVLAEVRDVRRVKMRKDPKKWMLDVTVGSGGHTLLLRWFNQPWRARELQVGREGLFAGTVEVWKGKRQLKNPDYELLGDSQDGAAGSAEALLDFTGFLIPVYPAADKLQSWKIAQSVRYALTALDPPDDPLPLALRERHGLPDLATALDRVHRPVSRDQVRTAVERLKWDEALVLQVTLAQRRAAARRQPSPPRPHTPGGLADAFDAGLPFTLTEGQRRVGAAVAADLAREHPMSRLLQGEVGSGKTVVALRAMLAVVDTGGQAALLAPTEVLAAQHARTLRALLGPLGQAGELGAADPATRVVLLTGSTGAAARRTALAAVADGSAGLVVGTHALIQEGVTFADLGLVVVDEQHRFGVEQRDALRLKARRGSPHVLVMTATPIPRTVAMTVYGDLETSTLRELPAGRAPVATSVVPTDRPRWLERCWARVVEEVAAGRRAYVVCPRIGDAPAGDGSGSGSIDDEAAGPGDSEGDLDPRRPPLAVLDVAPMLAAGPLADVRLEMLHGRLRPEDKESALRRFAAGEVDVLVATTVVEVGVDVAEASVMVVMDADRFGVSQLHQLRGRVGRGGLPGWCLLVTDAPEGSPARDRLDAVAATSDGFRLAQLDLEQRREGDVLGAAQSGRRGSLRLLQLVRDEALILAAREEATRIVDADETLAAHPALAAALADVLDQDRAGYLEKG